MLILLDENWCFFSFH